MENLLHQAADGSAKGWRKWYALSHAAQCGRCGRFLDRLRSTLAAVRSAKPEPDSAALERLKAGKWKEEIKK
jgi:hypothetical protein